jgi:hypothetical protein
MQLHLLPAHLPMQIEEQLQRLDVAQGVIVRLVQAIVLQRGHQLAGIGIKSAQSDVGVQLWACMFLPSPSLLPFFILPNDGSNAKMISKILSPDRISSKGLHHYKLQAVVAADRPADPEHQVIAPEGRQQHEGRDNASEHRDVGAAGSCVGGHQHFDCSGAACADGS